MDEIQPLKKSIRPIKSEMRAITVYPKLAPNATIST
jgi:hypothetical protein